MTETLDRQITAHEIARRLNPELPNTYGPACCSNREGIRGYGKANAEVMFIGIAPGRQEMKIGRPLVGPSGQLLDATLKACGFDRAQSYATNLCCFWKDEPTQAEIEGCSSRLLAEIMMINPRLIVTLGALATERLTGRKVGSARGAIIPSNLNMSEWPEWEFQAAMTGITVLPTWHPAAILRVPSMGNDLVRDFLKIPRFLAGELDHPHITTMENPIDNPATAQIIMNNLRGRVVAADVETEDDSEDAMSRVICMAVAIYGDSGGGIGTPSIRTYVFTRRALEGIEWPVNDVHWVFHNGQFDTQAIYRTFGVWLPIKDDTMLLSYACDERPGYNEGKTDRRGGAHGPGYHGLKVLAREYCSAGWYESDVKGTLGKSLDEIAEPQLVDDENAPILTEEENAEVKKRKIARKVAQRLETPDEAKARYDAWLREFYRYNILDAAYTLSLLSRLPKERDDRCYREVLIPAANAYARVQHGGIQVDQNRLGELVKEFAPKIEALRLDLQRQAHDLGYRNEPKLKRDLKARDEYEAEHGTGTWPNYEPLNLGSNKQMGEFLFKGLKLRPLMFTKKGGKPSTSADHLTLLKHPFCEAVAAQNQAEHVFNTYYLQATKHIRADSRFHAYPWLHGTTSGRRSYTEPAMQTFPQPYAFQDFPQNRDLSKIREIIVPSSPDMVLIEADYSQIEVWVGALLSGDQNMLADLQLPYQSTTGETEPDYHSTVARNILRCTAPDGSDEMKAVRQLAKTTTFSLMYLVEDSHFATIISRPKREAAKIRFDWYKRYQDFGLWQQSILKEMRQKGEITTPFGYRRRFPIVLDRTMDKVAVNHPIQSTGGTLSLLALVELEQTIKAVNGRVLLDVHDSLLVEAPRDRVHEACQRIRQAMCNPRIPGWPQLKVDIKIGQNWGSMMSESKWHQQ